MLDILQIFPFYGQEDEGPEQKKSAHPKPRTSQVPLRRIYLCHYNLDNVAHFATL